MKKKLIAALLLPFIASADDKTFPLEFSQGDILSAEIVNLMVSKINSIAKTPQESDLNGAWSCEEARVTCQDGVAGWIEAESGLSCRRTQTLEFSGGGDTPLLMSSSVGFPLRSTLASQEGNQPMESVQAALVGETGLLTFIHQSGIRGVFYIKSSTEMKFTYSEIAQANSGSCSRLSTPPSPPTALSYAVNDGLITISWLDQSDDEVSFKVQSKNDTNDDWVTIDTLQENTVEVTLDVLEDVKWIRVLSSNEFGDSDTSNELYIVND